MARGRKAEKPLILEEKLAQALVPSEEEPYPVPENWCWCRVSAICDFERGITFPASAKEVTLTEKNIPCLRTANIQEELEVGDLIFVDKKYMKQNTAKLVCTDDIILSSANSRELVGKTSYVYDVPFPMTFGGFVLAIRARAIVSKYLFHFLRLEFFSGSFMGESTQTTNIANVNTTKLGNFVFPLPPLAEQQRIVVRVESLFIKLNKAKEKAQAVADSFEARKAAILYQAFTGKMTEQWRKTNKRTLDSWQIKKIDEVCVDIKVGIVIKPSQYYTDEVYGTPAFRSANVRENHIDNFDWVYLNDKGMKENRRSIVHMGDVLIVRSGNPGTACVVTEEFDGYNAIDVLIAVPNPEFVLSEYLCFFTNSPLGKNNVSKEKRGMALAHFNVKSYSKVNIRLPLLDEQKEVVHILNDLLAKERQAKEIAEAVLEQIDTMKKSILARAFRGELGTNDPAEEGAVELLKKELQKEG